MKVDLVPRETYRIPGPADLGFVQKPRSERMDEARRVVAARIVGVVSSTDRTTWPKAVSLSGFEADLIDELRADVVRAGWAADYGPDSFWIRPMVIPEGPIKRTDTIEGCGLVRG